MLNGADLEVRARELVGLVGENGSGKTVLMQIVVGLLKRDGGEVRRPGRRGYCPQSGRLICRGRIGDQPHPGRGRLA